jgi:hypothetical protein
MRRLDSTLSIALVNLYFLTACSGLISHGAPLLPPATNTPDPCTPQNLPGEVKKVNDLMREFDDDAFIAQSTNSAQLAPLIQEMQRIRRTAEDQQTPACLANLKEYQLAHMNAVITTLVYLMGGAKPEDVFQGIASSQKFHEQYTREWSRLLGITLTVPVSPTFAAAASAPAVSSLAPSTSAPALSPTPGNLPLSTLPAGPFVTNLGPTTVNIRAKPALDGQTLGILAVGAVVPAFGKTADNQWIQIEMPGQPGRIAWVYAPLVLTSIPPDELPIVTLAP